MTSIMTAVFLNMEMKEILNGKRNTYATGSIISQKDKTKGENLKNTERVYR